MCSAARIVLGRDRLQVDRVRLGARERYLLGAAQHAGRLPAGAWAAASDCFWSPLSAKICSCEACAVGGGAVPTDGDRMYSFPFTS